MKEGFSLGADHPIAHVAEPLSRTDERPAHITESRLGESGEAA